MSTMTSPEAQQARQRLRKLARDRQRIEDTEDDAIADALRAGVRQVDVAQDIGRTREHIRRIAKRYGIPGRRADATDAQTGPQSPR